MRKLPALLTAALTLGCAGVRAPAAAPERGEATVLRAAELARVRCLLVAPLENASDAPLAADAATGALLSGVDPSRARVFPVPELRGLFRDTPLELPEGVPPTLALELAELLGADAALYGTVEGRSREAEPNLLVTLRLVLAGQRDLVFATTAPVRPWPGEAAEAAVRRTVIEAAEPMLGRLGDPGRKRCFDPERTKKLRALALVEAKAVRTLALSPAGPAPKPSAAQSPLRPQTRTPRQAEWARRLGESGRFVAEDVAFAGRTSDLQRDGGLADLAVALAAVPDAKIRIEAFVDSTSKPEDDGKLTAAMAKVAVQRLVDLGVPGERVSWVGRGSESPLLPNFTVRGRAANRRLEVVGLR